LAFATPAKPSAITANNKVALMRFIFFSFEFCRVNRSRPAASAGVFADVREFFGGVLDAEEVGLQNGFPAVVQACERKIFCERTRMVCDINCEGLSWSVRNLEARVRDGLLRDGVRQAARDGTRIVFLLVRRIRRVRMMAAGHFHQSGLSGMRVVS
jgi:hypothetical protein